MQDAGELLDAFRARRLSPVEALELVAERIERVGSLVNAFTTTCLKRAREEAGAAERRYARGEARELEGVPFAAKDLLDSAGVRTTYGSALFRSNVPDRDAAAVAALRAAGAILVGKSATHEFGWGITTASETFGPTLNPWAPERTPGGSSGGSGAALAAGLVPLALGTDTGGSIRMPSAFCGVAGLKPSFGAVSTDGVRPLGRSLDHVGPMARTPADLARLLETLSAVRASERVREAEADPPSALEGLRIGVLPERPAVPLAPDVRAVFDYAEELLAGLGARLVEFHGPDVDEAYDTYATILMSEALAEHRRAGTFPARSEEYGSDVRARMRLAEEVSEAEAAAARERRSGITAEFERGLEDVDVVLSPVSPGPPALHADGDEVTHLGERLPFRRFVIPYVVVQDLGGFPACVVRGGFDAHGLPVGLQLSAARGADTLVLATAAAWFAATPELQRQWPPLAER